MRPERVTTDSPINSEASQTSEPKVRISDMVGRHIVHNCPGVAWVGGKVTKTVDIRDVILMAVSGSYAMVRRPRCMPYVASVRELEVPSNGKLTDAASAASSATGVTD